MSLPGSDSGGKECTGQARFSVCILFDCLLSPVLNAPRNCGIVVRKLELREVGVLDGNSTWLRRQFELIDFEAEQRINFRKIDALWQKSA
ncbi:MAG: hypothetical protein ACI87E_002339 [Mariniblastus sp.]|jgi:hypothetical protein